VQIRYTVGQRKENKYMPNLTSILNEQIRRLARREITAKTKGTRRLTAQYRRDIAALKRQVSSLQKTVTFLDAREKKRAAEAPNPQEAEHLRFRVAGLQSHRAQLGLSAKDYGRLVGASGVTIYSWETGKRRPREAQLAKLAAIREIGKREALKRLGLLGVTVERKDRKPGSYKETGEELILSLLKRRKALTGAEINAEWRKSGRPGICNYLISQMVTTGKLKRTVVRGERGGRYSIA
jgi:DNA-binding transcriptional regulator YiaG